MICSNCLENEGLELEARKIGTPSETPCSNCGAVTGIKLNSSQINQLIENFFLNGSVDLKTSNYGARYKTTSVPDQKFLSGYFDGSLQTDIGLLTKKHQFGLDLSSMRSWDAGITDLYLEVKEVVENCTSNNCLTDQLRTIFDKVIDACASFELLPGAKIYRIRLDPTDAVTSPLSYDTAPSKVRSPFRFNGPNSPVFYGSLDVETCIHECRTTVYNEVVLATFKTQNKLRLIDFEKIIIDADLNSNIQSYLNLLFSSGDDSYKESQLLAERIKERGYDGIKYCSYYSMVRSGDHSNIALFGYPVNEGKLSLQSLNRIKLDRIIYEYTFGPLNL